MAVLFNKRDLARSSSWYLAVSLVCALAMAGLPAANAIAQDEPSPPQSSNSDADRRLTNRPLNPRESQDLDEPRLLPLFGRSRNFDQGPVIDSKDDVYQPDSADREGGFTGILTFLIPEATDLSLGVGPVYRPDYFGSNDYIFDVDPQAYLRLKNFVFFDDDGADLALFGFSGFKFGPSIRLVGRRSEDDNPALAGLGNVGTTFEAGGFASTTFINRYAVKFKVRKGIETGHRGLIVDAFGTALLFSSGRFSMSASAQASWIGENYADTYFSIDVDQSKNSGLPIYDARKGVRNIGGSVNGYINIGKRWSLNPYVSYDLVIGNIADTPIIADFGSPHQVRAGFHVIRQIRLFEKSR